MNTIDFAKKVRTELDAVTDSLYRPMIEDSAELSEFISAACEWGYSAEACVELILNRGF